MASCSRNTSAPSSAAADTALFNYLLDWMADVVQHPGKQGEVASCCAAPKARGKGILARAMKYLLGQHGFAISNAKHLTGNFNAHLRDCVFLFADEAFYAGDKAHVGILKSHHHRSRSDHRGQVSERRQAANCLHIMMAINETVGGPRRHCDSRRCCVLDVDDSHANDHAYFAAIQDELEHGGYEAMLHELLNRDISPDNLRKSPSPPP